MHVVSVKVLTPTFRKYVIIFLKYILNAILWRYISVHIILYSAIDIFFILYVIYFHINRYT